MTLFAGWSVGFVQLPRCVHGLRPGCPNHLDNWSETGYLSDLDLDLDLPGKPRALGIHSSDITNFTYKILIQFGAPSKHRFFLRIQDLTKQGRGEF